MPLFSLAALPLLLVLGPAAPDAGGDWPTFRGPNGSGLAGPGRLPAGFAGGTVEIRAAAGR